MSIPLLLPTDVINKHRAGAVLVDVRTPQETADGIIEGAIVIDLQVFETRYIELEPFKEKEIILDGRGCE